VPQLCLAPLTVLIGRGVDSVADHVVSRSSPCEGVGGRYATGFVACALTPAATETCELASDTPASTTSGAGS